SQYFLEGRHMRFSFIKKAFLADGQLKARRRRVGQSLSTPAEIRSFLTKTEQLEGRSLLSAVSWVGHGDGHSWTDAANWSTGTIPASNDDVTIDAAAGTAIQGPSAQTSINSLNIAFGNLTLSGGLSIAANSTIGAGATVSVGAGVTLTQLSAYG